MNFTNSQLLNFIDLAITEDVGDGDHTSLSTIPAGTQNKAQLLVKENGILAGVEVAKVIFDRFDSNLKVNVFLKDGDLVNIGDVVLTVEGSAHSILKAERLVLNIMQRMSGIATYTNSIVKKVSHTKCKILDTRKTTPNMRFLEKYLNKTNRTLPIEIETISLAEVEEAIKEGGFQRSMFDNFSFNNIREGVKIVDGKFETEASGGITSENVVEYAECGIDFISIGALTHSVKSLDLSLKAI